MLFDDFNDQDPADPPPRSAAAFDPRRRRPTIFGLLIAATLLVSGGARSETVPREPSSCALAGGFLRTVTAVTGSDAITLDDGTEVKLAGFIGARAADIAAAVAAWPPETAAVDALSALVLGRTVSVHPVASRADRYRRLVAHVVVDREGDPLWVQGEMLARGHGRAFSMTGDAACVLELLAHERSARLGRVGIWTNAAYFERAAYRTYELMRLRGTFQIVSGRVRKVSEVKSALFLNFGTDWHSDFTAGLRISNSAPFDSALVAEMRLLEGRRVRVRGWIDRRNGPYVEIAHRSDIEVLDTPPRAEPAEDPASIRRPER